MIRLLHTTKIKKTVTVFRIVFFLTYFFHFISASSHLLNIYFDRYFLFTEYHAESRTVILCFHIITFNKDLYISSHFI